jgi:predicted TIM-barrel fold metal-dependent hydrolase
MFHVGSSVFPGAKHRFADPMAIDEVAADFPDLELICAHAGRGFWEQQTFFLAKLRPNVHLEMSGLPAARIAATFPELERIADRVLYGSDWPTAPALGTVAERFLALPYSESALRAMTFENAARLLRIQADGSRAA